VVPLCGVTNDDGRIFCPFHWGLLHKCLRQLLLLLWSRNGRRIPRGDWKWEQTIRLAVSEVQKEEKSWTRSLVFRGNLDFALGPF